MTPASDRLHALRRALKGRYTVERVLGRGGMAVVLLARETRYDRPVAIKVLSPDVSSAVASERFLREIRITAQLQHPHILPLLDSGEAAGLLYAVMPYVEGETLRDRLLAGGALPDEEALLIAREVADALEYAHRRGVIHRDIKPENILVSHGHAIVADFGIARAVGLAGQTLTGGGLPLGTAAYMSPEQAAGRSDVDARTDVYSLGCLLYEMLTGRMAFGAQSLRETVRSHLEGRYVPLETLRPDLPEATVAWVTRALATDRERRFASAAEAAAGLRLLLGEQARTPTPPEAAWTPPGVAPAGGAPAEARGGRWLVGAAVLALGALGALQLWPDGTAQDGAAVAVTAASVRRTDPAAYDAFLRGSFWLERRTPDGFGRAHAAFSEAVARDSSYAAALAGLADAKVARVIYGVPTPEDPYAEVAAAARLAERALALDSTLAEAWLARAEARTLALAPPADVLADLTRATTLLPGAAPLRMTFAHALARAGAADSAMTVAEAALAMDPLSPGLRHQYVALALGLRRYQPAIREAEHALSLDPNDRIAAVLESYALLLSGRPERCAARELGGWPAVRATCLETLGRPAEARRLADSLGTALLAAPRGGIHQFTSLAIFHAWRGDADSALTWLEHGLEQSPAIRHWQLTSGLFDRVQAVPTFRQGLARARARVRERIAAR